VTSPFPWWDFHWILFYLFYYILSNNNWWILKKIQVDGATFPFSTCLKNLKSMLQEWSCNFAESFFWWPFPEPSKKYWIKHGFRRSLLALGLWRSPSRWWLPCVCLHSFNERVSSSALDSKLLPEKDMKWIEIWLADFSILIRFSKLVSEVHSKSWTTIWASPKPSKFKLKRKVGCGFWLEKQRY